MQDTCWFDDRCLNTWHYYKAKGYCKSTMEENENCGNVDRCSSGVVEYPKCHQDVYWGE